MTPTMHPRHRDSSTGRDRGAGRDRVAGRDRGFTLLEVMLALSILAVTLVGLLGRTTGNVRLTQESALRGTAAALARGQMYEVEDQLLREGFQDLDQNLEGDFTEQGWPQIEWEAAIEKVEIPGMEGMKAMQGGAGEGAAGEGQDQEGAGGMIGSILSMGGMGGLGGGEGGEDTSVDAAMISSQFEMFRQLLEASIRKVTLTVTWKVGNEDQQMVVVCYFTDPGAMQEVLPGIGGAPSGGGGEDGTGEGPESGTGRGDGVSGGGSRSTPRTPPGGGLGRGGETR
jgi:prepilin-type N-terminal cleavage/methylation domain-containing protein